MQRTLSLHREWLLSRPRLNTLLEQGAQYPLLLLLAAPGYGKTTALADFSQQTEKRLVWLDLHPLDNDFGRFWERLLRAFQQELPKTAAALAGLRPPDSLSQFDAFVRVFSAALAEGEQVLLVLDRYECLQQKRIRAFVRDLLALELANFCLVIISNAHAAVADLLPVARYYLLTEEELRFTEEEIRSFCRQNDYPCTEEHIQRLIQETAGWPLAIHLLLGGDSSQADSALPAERSQRQMIDDLFAAKYFQDYAAAKRQILLLLADFEWFPAGLLQAAFPEDCEDISAMMQENAFLFSDPLGQGFSLHPLYRDFLRKHQFLLPEDRRRQFLRRAGAWYLAERFSLEAMECFWQIHDYAGFLAAVLQMPKKRYSIDTTNLILSRLNQFPAEQRQPAVDFCRGFMHFNAVQVAKAKELFLSVVEQLAGSTNQQQLLGDTYAALSDIAICENSLAGLDYIKKAAALLPEGSHVRSPSLLVIDQQDIFFLPDQEPGRIPDMIDYFFTYAPYADQLFQGSGNGIEYLFAAEASFYAGDFSMAMEYSYKAIFKAQSTKQHDIVCNANYLQMRVALYQGNYQGASLIWERIADYLRGHQISELLSLQDWAKSWLYLSLGQPEQVSSWLTNDAAHRRDQPLSLGRNQLIYVRYQLALQDYGAAYAALLELDEVLAASGLWCTRLSYHLLKAICLLATGAEERATAELFSAYQMTEANAIITPFAEQGRAMLALIELARRQQTYFFQKGWLTRVEEDTQHYCKRNSAMRKLYHSGITATMAGIHLTAREHEVLRLLAQGLTRDEISLMLGISLHGVKKHITGIYTKLGAVNRAEALRIAALNNLLPED